MAVIGLGAIGGSLAWQARMAELLEIEDDYSGTDSGIRPVWELPAHG